MQVVHGARNRGQHEERRLIDLNLVFQAFDVARNGGVCVKGKANNKANMGGNIRSMPGIDEVAIVCRIILFLISRLQVIIIDALHPDEHLRTACLPC